MDIVGSGTKVKGIHPLEDKEGYLKFLFNDGKEVSKVIFPNVYQTRVQQPGEMVQPHSAVMQSYVHCNDYTATPNINMPLKIKFKVSRATRVVEPEPPTPDPVILIDDDDEEDENDDCKIISGSFTQNRLSSTTRVSHWQYPQEQDLPNLKLGEESFYQQTSDDSIPKLEIEELKTTILTQPSQDIKQMTQPTSEEEPFVDTAIEYRTQDTGVNLRVEDLQLESNLEELLKLMNDSNIDFEEPETRSQIKEAKYQKGKVVYGDKSALLDLLDDFESLRAGEHGVMCKGVYPAYQNQYECENIKKGIKGQYSVERTIGTGSYGIVQLCVDRSTKKEFVKKTIFKEFNRNEVTILLNLEHANIVQLFGFIQKDGYPQVFMENAGTSLLHFTVGQTTCDRLNDTTIWDLTKQGLSALEYLDYNGIIHFDIKPENLCIIDQKTTLELKLTDFGSAKTSTDPMDFKGWTAEYMAPELGRAFLKSKSPQMFDDGGGRFLVCGKADVFAFALVTLFMYQKRHVLMHFFTNGKDSYKEVVNPDELRFGIICANVKDPDTVVKLMISDKCSADMKIILQGMLAGSPRDRLSASQARRKMEAMETRVIQQPSSPFGDSWSFLMGNENQTTATARHMYFGGRQSSVSPVVSSFGSNIGSPLGFPSSTGPVKMKIARKKQRRKVAEPYNNVNKDVDHNYKDLKPAENLDGNVPNFGLF